MVMLDQNVIKHIKKSNEFYLKIFTWMMNYRELLQQKPSSDQVT